MTLKEAVEFAKHDAESRLCMLPMDCEPLERNIIEAQVKIYAEALEAGGDPAMVGELVAALQRYEAVIGQLNDAMPLQGEAQNIMVQGYVAHAITTSRTLLARVNRTPHHCYRCGKSSAIVNGCGCDPGNMPTRVKRGA